MASTRPKLHHVDRHIELMFRPSVRAFGVAKLKTRIVTNDNDFNDALSAKIGITGGGFSGPMTGPLFEWFGMYNGASMNRQARWADGFAAKYLNGAKPKDYQDQEMGGMKFLLNVTYADTNE
ncbi:uncharacterized protein Z518_07119 [Rhinocladiella mackenziei CBS 650.93]|uniref:Rhinocladiella mackenziei CBS 650.93 unplaced genomic scaffold supercont1.5, whole genome shotgun sequence n=1 Tax=Rhinocladiella mackenziei CBS 650.93 TaxID=1442369 RepID=A0A0D2IK23_9EURO|nr:uncharacterized protein Z518_07119 [Rhinocladiella mackenziei CBS 650.93]KIX03566.1 hypothetical protein Z518_07119 [Rhinocladiella mackenziei CBS 650.93]